MKRKRLTKKERARLTKETIIHQERAAYWFRKSIDQNQTKDVRRSATYWRQQYANKAREDLIKLIGE